MRARGRRVLLPVAAVLLVAGAALVAGVPRIGPTRTPEVGPEFPATAMDISGGYANNSPMLVADPNEPRFVVMASRLDAPVFGCTLQASGDGGRSFIPVRPLEKLPDGAERCYAPEVAFDRDGTLHYLFVGLRGEGNQAMGVFLTTSKDRAATFSTPRRVLGPFNYGVRMAIDTSGSRDRLHLAYLHASTDPPTGGLPATDNPILSSYSDDGGQTFSEPVRVNDPARTRAVAPALALGERGSVHIAYYDLGDDARDYQGLEGPVWEGSWSIVLASSGDRGATFSPGRVVDDGIVPHERVMLIFTMPAPALVVDGDRRCVAWTDARHGDADALVRCSADAGASWGELRRANDDPMGNGRSQYQPRLGLAPGGRLDVVFYDRRNDPADRVNEVSYAYSTDGAASFSPNRILTADLSDSRVGQRYANVSARNLVEFGSRIGLLSTRAAAVAAWTDTRNSRGGTSQDVFSVVVDFPERAQPAWARLAGAALLAAGVALAAAAIGRSGRRAGGGTGEAGEGAAS